MINGFLSISAERTYITEARCLHGTAQSGQEQFMLKSFHEVGKTLILFSFAIVFNSEGNSLLSKRESNKGFELIALINMSFC